MKRVTYIILLLLLITSGSFASTQTSEPPSHNYFAPEANYAPHSENSTRARSLPISKSGASFIFSNAFTAFIVANGIDARFAIIQYSDPNLTKTYYFEGNSPWTSDVSLVEAGLEQAANSINGGWEVPNEAIYYMLQLQFRPKASKFAFLLTDEGAEVFSEQDRRLQTMTELAKQLKKQKIITTVIGEDREYYRNQLEVIVNETGGQYLDIGSQDYYLLMLDIASWIGEITGLNVDILEKGRVNDYLAPQSERYKYHNLIADSTNSKYYVNGNGNVLKEKNVANSDATLYSKKGYTADGNTRLILRVQHNQPGSVKFEVDKEFGTLERLTNRAEIDSSVSIPTEEISAGKLYQASAVLVAPETFPLGTLGGGFPERDFTVKITFTPVTGTPETITKTLSIHATPVVFVHGLNGNPASFTNSAIAGLAGFNMSEMHGAYQKVNGAKVTTGFWDYNTEAYEGPTYHIIDKFNNNILSDFYTAICATIAEKVKNEIACTRVDLVCHSMGGLMARVFDAYESRTSDFAYYNGMLRRIITIATPQEGSPIPVYLLGKADELPYIKRGSVQIAAEENPLRYMRVIDILKDSNILQRVQNLLPHGSYNFSGSSFPGAWKDLAFDSDIVKSLRDENNGIGRPRVPISIIYGKIRDDINSHTAHWILNHLPLPEEYQAIINEAPDLLSNGDEFRALFGVMFDHRDFDIAVGEPSARSIFTNQIAFEGAIDANHLNICHDGDVGDAVLERIKEPLGNNFDTSGVNLPPYVPPSKSSKKSSSQPVNIEKSYAAEDNFITKYTLEIDSASTIAPSPTQDVAFKVTAEDPIEHDVYLSLKGDDWGTFIKLESLDNELKTFGTTITFTSNDNGIFQFHALSQANASESDKTYISETQTLKIIPSIEYDDEIEKLDFASSILTLKSGIETNLALLAETKNGRLINIPDIETAQNFGINLSISDSNVAEITSEGKLKALSQGTATLTASCYRYSNYSNIEASVEVEVDIVREHVEPPEPTEKNLIITTSSLAKAQAGYYYTEILESTLSITDPVVWSVSGLPSGLSCDVGGIISGKPTTSGTFTLDITASNDDEIDTKTLELEIALAAHPEAPIISTQNLPAGLINEEYSANISAVVSGDSSEISWSFTGGYLPNGVEIQNYSGASVEIFGTPAETGSFTFSVQASANGYSDSQSFTIFIDSPSVPEIITSILPDGIVGQDYQATISAISNNLLPITLKIIKGNLPAGLSLSSDGIITGKPSEAGNFEFVVAAENSIGTTSRDLTLKINEAAKTTSPDITPAPVQSTSEDVAPIDFTPDPGFTIGRLRTVSSLNANVIAMLSNDRNIIAAVFPEIIVVSSDTYDFDDVEIYSNVPAGLELVWNPFESDYLESSATKSINSNSARFYDENGNEIKTVPADHVINVSTYLEGGKIYAPVITARISRDQSNDDDETLGSSGAGCNLGTVGIIVLFMVAGLFRKFS